MNILLSSTENFLNNAKNINLGISVGNIGDLFTSAAMFLSLCLGIFFITMIIFRNIKSKSFNQEKRNLLNSNQSNISNLLNSIETLKNRDTEGFEKHIESSLAQMDELLEESRLTEVELSNIKLPISNYESVSILFSEYRKKIKNCKLDIPSVDNLVRDIEGVQSNNEELLTNIEKSLNKVGTLLSSVASLKEEHGLHTFNEDVYGQRLTEIYEHYKGIVSNEEDAANKGEAYSVVLNSLEDLDYTLVSVEEQLVVATNLPSLLDTHKKGLEQLFKGYEVDPRDLGIYNKFSEIEETITNVYKHLSSGSLEASQELLQKIGDMIGNISEEAAQIKTMDSNNEELIFKVEYQINNHQNIDELFQSNLQELHDSFSSIHWEYVIELFEESKEKLAKLKYQFHKLKQQKQSKELNFVQVNEIITSIQEQLESVQSDLDEALNLSHTLNSKLEERRNESKTISKDFEQTIGKHHNLLENNDRLRELLESIQLEFSELQQAELQKPFDLLVVSRKQENLKTLIDEFSEVANEHYEKQTEVTHKISTLQDKMKNDIFSEEAAKINENLTAVEYLIKAGMLDEALKEINSLEGIVLTLEEKKKHSDENDANN